MSDETFPSAGAWGDIVGWERVMADEHVAVDEADAARRVNPEAEALKRLVSSDAIHYLTGDDRSC